MTFEQWNGRVGDKTRAIVQAADIADWTTVSTLVAEFAELLKTPQTDPDLRTREVFKRAQNLITRILDMACDARESARADIQQIGKGRKAIAAYR